MPNIKSAIKRHTQSLKRRANNREHRSATRTSIKNFLTSIAAGDKTAATEALQKALSRIDKTGKLGVIHPKTADRLKSRLTLRFNRAFNA